MLCSKFKDILGRFYGESIVKTRIVVQADSQVWRASRPLTQRDESSDSLA